MRIRIVVLSTVIAAAGAIGPLHASAASGHPGTSRAGQQPSVRALKVTGRTAHSLSFSARVDARGLTTKAELIAKYHRRTVGGATRSAGSGSTARTLNFTITHLHAHRSFHVRITAINSAGSVTSQVITATTKRLRG